MIKIDWINMIIGLILFSMGLETLNTMMVWSIFATIMGGALIALSFDFTDSWGL